MVQMCKMVDGETFTVQDSRSIRLEFSLHNRCTRFDISGSTKAFACSYEMLLQPRERHRGNHRR